MTGTTDPPARRFLFLLTSGRCDGNSELLARRAASVLAVEVKTEWLRLLDQPLPVFRDIRHDGDGTYPPVDGSAVRILEATLAASDIVFVSPLYWYSLPAPAKLYLDHWSAWMRVPELNFTRRMAGKRVWAITALSDENYSVANPLIETLKLSAAYMNMRWSGVLLGFGNRPGEILQDEVAGAQADLFFAGPENFEGIHDSV